MDPLLGVCTGHEWNQFGKAVLCGLQIARQRSLPDGFPALLGSEIAPNRVEEAIRPGPCHAIHERDVPIRRCGVVGAGRQPNRVRQALRVVRVVENDQRADRRPDRNARPWPFSLSLVDIRDLGQELQSRHSTPEKTGRCGGPDKHEDRGGPCGFDIEDITLVPYLIERLKRCWKRCRIHVPEEVKVDLHGAIGHRPLKGVRRNDPARIGEQGIEGSRSPIGEGAKVREGDIGTQRHLGDVAKVDGYAGTQPRALGREAQAQAHGTRRGRRTLQHLVAARVSHIQ